MTGANKLLAAALAIVGLCLGGEAQANEITYTFTAEITDTRGSLPFSPGSLVNGSFTYRSDLTATSTAANVSTYGGAGVLSLIVGGFEPSGIMDQLRITNSNDDEFLLRSSTIFDSSEIVLSDSSATAFDGTDIPAALFLSAFDEATFELDFEGFGRFSGTITEMMLLTPEPGTGALLGLGLAALATARRRR